MPTPTNRAKIQLVRGSYANILAGLPDLIDGELCYAKDQNKLYMVEGAALTPLDYLANTDITETVQDVIGAAISGGVGLTSAYNDTTGLTTIDLDNTAVTAGTYGSASAIPAVTVDQQGRITSITTNNVGVDLGVSADTGASQVINLLTETLAISGADGITTTTTTNGVSIDLDNTAVTPATYGDGNTVGQFIVDQQGRITSATDVNISIAHTAISDWATAVRGTTGIDQTGEPMGHAARLDSTISFNVSTRTFSIAPVGANYVVWCKGVKFIKTTTSTLVLPNTTGLYYIYFDPSGALQFRTSYFDWENDAPTAYIYWNATDGAAPYFADERHGITLDWATHEYLHRTRGAVIANGFSISNFTIAGSGAVDSDCHVDIAGGTFFDEDLEVIIVQSNSPAANSWEQDLAGPAQIPVIYLNGTAWRKDAATDFPFKQGSVRPQYNSYNSGAGTWSTVDAGINKFIVQFVVATHSLGTPVLAVMGQGDYTNIGDAEAVDFNELTLSGFPSVEFRPLYKLIYQVGSYANSVDARLRSVIDIRQISSSGVGQALGSDHGNLSGLGDDDHLQYLHATNNRTGVTANIATSGTLSTTNATVSTSSGTGALIVTGGVGVGGSVNIAGSLTVAGTTVTLDAETLLIEDKNIEMGVVATPSDATADGGGITLRGTTDKTISWIDGTDAWTFSEHVNIASAKEYRIAGTKVLDATSLGSAVVGSSLTSVGTISTGVWNGTAITDTYLATISTAGKVSNSATTSTDLNTASAIVSRDSSGNFTAGTITAALTGTASGNLALAGGTVTGNVILDNQVDARFREATANGTNYVGFQAPASIAADILWTLPAIDGNNGQALITSGTGSLSWGNAGGGANGADIEKFDNISSGFNSSTTSFNLTVSGVAYSPPYINALIISIGGVIQEASTAYTISGNVITFTSAPSTGSSFFGFDFGSPAAIAIPGSAYQLLRTNSTATSTEWATIVGGSNVTVANSNGAITITAAGGGATGGSTDKVFFENDQTVTTNYTLTASKNAMTAGPVTINSGATVTIPSGASWVII